MDIHRFQERSLKSHCGSGRELSKIAQFQMLFSLYFNISIMLYLWQLFHKGSGEEVKN